MIFSIKLGIKGITEYSNISRAFNLVENYPEIKANMLGFFQFVI